MILEIVTFKVVQGNEKRFIELARRHAENMTSGSYKCYSVQFGKDSHDLQEVTAVVQWESLDAYQQFTQSEERLSWRKRIDEILSEPPSIRFLRDIETYGDPGAL